VKALVPGQQYPQYPIETGEVVHVGMGDKGMADAQDLTRRKSMQVPQVEEDGPFFEQEVDIQGRVVEGPVHQVGVEKGFHGGAPRNGGFLFKVYSILAV